ncbi:MAG: methylmalonyl Co-A mutase-associated GTPase MeaB [Rhodobacteraceae bacterium]|nr:methylmalonyl Co-A mutase-associated GTPase MeaB [Paracoccaceae bacterium]
MAPNSGTFATNWSKRLTAGDRRALARAITLVESSRDDDRALARELLTVLAPHTGGSLRIGLSGAPGVGKSTFIEAFGRALLALGERVAVLAVDPSSARGGGSILGDKTRMERLSRAKEAFIRPSPSNAALGGVARRTREVIRLCEAAGFTVTLIETVGVGQSETMVADMTDVFVLLLNPSGGDDLQGVKRGVMERADLILVNKADGELASAARATVSDYANALRLLRARPDDPPPEVQQIPMAMPVSALTGDGLESAWTQIADLANWRRDQGWRASRRRDQDVHWMQEEIERRLIARFAANPAVSELSPNLREAVATGSLSPEDAADRALAAFFSSMAAAKA